MRIDISSDSGRLARVQDVNIDFFTVIHALLCQTGCIDCVERVRGTAWINIVVHDLDGVDDMLVYVRGVVDDAFTLCDVLRLGVK